MGARPLGQALAALAALTVPAYLGITGLTLAKHEGTTAPAGGTHRMSESSQHLREGDDNAAAKSSRWDDYLISGVMPGMAGAALGSFFSSSISRVPFFRTKAVWVLNPSNIRLMSRFW